MGILSLSNEDCRSTASLGDYLSFTSKTAIVAEYEFIHLSPFPPEVKMLIKNLGCEKFFDLRSRGSTSYCPHVVWKFYHNLQLSGPCDYHLVSIFLGHRVSFQPHQFAESLILPPEDTPLRLEAILGVYVKEDQCAYLPVYRIVELTNTFIENRHTEHQETPEASSSKCPRLT
ncbi:unnamed protein product [Linum trigynum]|uniref:Uncharacterized protein n=1 Tax=Linum trigynum TaxID=586398 RepID=A0AAV2FZR9_9ROSI